MQSEHLQHKRRAEKATLNLNSGGQRLNCITEVVNGGLLLSPLSSVCVLLLQRALRRSLWLNPALSLIKGLCFMCSWPWSHAAFSTAPPLCDMKEVLQSERQLNIAETRNSKLPWTTKETRTNYFVSHCSVPTSLASRSQSPIFHSSCPQMDSSRYLRRNVSMKWMVEAKGALFLYIISFV